MKRLKNFRIAAVIAVLAALSGCAIVDTGVRVTDAHSPVTQTGSAPSSPSASPGSNALSIDPIAVLRADEQVPARVKELVAQPCAADDFSKGWFPVYTYYTTLHDNTQVAIINVQGCQDTAACEGTQASYVYRLSPGDPTQATLVYTPTESYSRVILTRAVLAVQQPQWQPNDPALCPSGSELVELEWDGETFHEKES